MGCKVKKNRHGYLAFQLIWEGMRSWEGTGLKDTPENRKLVEAKAVLITGEMKRGKFQYIRWFPHGNRAAYFDHLKAAVESKTVGKYFSLWISRKIPPLVRKSLEVAYRQHFQRYILQRFENNYLQEISPNHLEEFRSYLLHDLKLTLKTAKNIINGTLRAFMRDAQEIDKLIETNPCTALSWPVNESNAPDPLEIWERDKYLAWAKRRLPFKHYAFIYSQFYTGMRPSEATALRLGDVDLERGRAAINKSRHMSHEGATKTRASRRRIWLLPEVVELLHRIWPLHGGERDYLFTNKDNRPIHAGNWTKDFWRAGLRACGIRPRKFYATKHTFVSAALSGHLGIGWINGKRVSDQVGDSMATLERNYARYLEAGSETLSETFPKEKQQIVTNQMLRATSPTGFEPLLRYVEGETKKLANSNRIRSNSINSSPGKHPQISPKKGVRTPKK